VFTVPFRRILTLYLLCVVLFLCKIFAKINSRAKTFSFVEIYILRNLKSFQMIYARRCLGLKMPGQTVAPLFSLTPSRQPSNRRQSTSASFSSEILSAFSDKTNAVLDLTFGDGHHSRLLLGRRFFSYGLLQNINIRVQRLECF
jgi:hypothetical protein